MGNNRIVRLVAWSSLALLVACQRSPNYRKDQEFDRSSAPPSYYSGKPGAKTATQRF